MVKLFVSYELMNACSHESSIIIYEIMKIEDYRLLITLDETKTLRKAAEILYISQPAVTQRLKAIENAFGRYFIRTKTIDYNN